MTTKQYKVKVIEKVLYTFTTEFDDSYDIEEQAEDFMTNLFEDWSSGIQIGFEIEWEKNVAPLT